MHREQKLLDVKSKAIACMSACVDRRCSSITLARSHAADASLPASSLSAEDASSGRSSKLYSILLGQAPSSAEPTCTLYQDWPLSDYSQAFIVKMRWMFPSEIAA